MPRPEPIRRVLPLFLLLGLSAPMAFADAGHALNYSLRQSLTHDDNLFRLADGVAPVRAGGGARSDTQSSTEAAATFDWTYGIQRLKASLSATASRHRHNPDLDNDRHGESAAWLWRSGNRLDGELSWSRSTSQSSFADLSVPVRNIVTTSSGVASGNYWFHSDWSFGWRGTINEIRNSSAVQAGSDTRTEGAEMNLRFQPASGNTVSLRQVQTTGRYPNAQITLAGPVNNDYRQSESTVEVRYQTGGASDLSGSIGRVERRHEQVAARNFRGLTGRAGWSWRPTGKTGVNFAAQREIGAQSDATASFTLTEMLSAGVNWAPTAKITLAASVTETRRDFGGDPATALAGTATQTDTTRLLVMSASYLPLPRLSLSVSMQDERRAASSAVRDYRSRRAMTDISYAF